MESTPGSTSGSAVEVHLSPRELGARVVAEVTQGLTAPDAWLPLHHLRDQRTAELWSEIESSDEYRQGRSERGLVAAASAAAIDAVGTESVVMLGPTSAGAIEVLLEAAHRGDALHEFVAVGRTAGEVEDACARVRSLFPAATVRGEVADPVEQLAKISLPHRALVVVSGPTLGSLRRREQARFLAGLAARLSTGDAALLATDMTHDHHEAVAAYDDAGGRHADRARNALVILQRELAAELDPAGWFHVVHWNDADHAVDLSLAPKGDQRIVIPSLGIDRRFARGDQIHLERNRVFLSNGFNAQLAFAALQMVQLWTNPTEDYAVSLVTS